MLPFVKSSVLYWLEIVASAALLFALVCALMRTGPARAWGALRRAANGISGRHARRAVELVADGVMVADLRKQGFPVVYVNPAFEAITGNVHNSSTSNNMFDLLGETAPLELDAVHEAMGRREAAQVTLSLHHEDGKTTRTDLYVEPQYSALGRATHCIVTLRDANQAHQPVSKHQHSEQNDRLSGLASNNSFHDQFAQMLRRDGSHHTLVIKIDIRHFHDINTCFGYPAGDLLLREIGERLRSLPHAAIGRLGADDFAVALPLPNPEAAKGVIAGLQTLLGAEFRLPNAPLKVRFAIGYALGQRPDEPAVLLRRAGVALHEAKASRFVDVREFDRNAATRVENRARLTRDLQHAIEHGELLLYYQPKVELATGEITGAEALLRWDDPSFGLQEPNSFIPVAEDSGLIVEIGAWCLRRAAAFAVRLNRKRQRPLVVSVNVSKFQFEYADVPLFLESVIHETGIDPSWLMLELTETVLTDNSAVMIKTLRKLREMGFGLSIDDFGTAYSSLGYLEAFPFSEFKIDRTFVSGLDENRPRQAIVEAMIRLGRELQISVTAEGPETEAELAVLHKLNCPYVQGYIFGRPMTEDDFTKLVDLPKAPAANATPGMTDAAVGFGARNAILIDDDPLVREVIGEALEVLGWDVTPLATAETALAMADVLPTPRLIVTDVNLGAGMTGFDLLPHARRRWPDAGIIVISGRPVEPDALAILGEHEVFLAKPASIATLGDAITKVVASPTRTNSADADVANRVSYAARSVADSPVGWGELAIDGAVALAPNAAPSTQTETHDAPAMSPRFEVQTTNRAPATTSRLNLAEEVRDLLSQMARPVNRKTVRLLVAIEPDITILANSQAFRQLLSRLISDAIADTGASGGRVLLTAFPNGRTVRLVVTDEAETADPAHREATLRYATDWVGIPDGGFDVRLVSGGGIEVTVSLAAA